MDINMERIDYELACRKLALLSNHHLVVLDGLDTNKRPLFKVVSVCTDCEVKINGRFFYGVACLDMNSQTVKWYSYNDIAGYKNYDGVQLDGIDRMLSTRFGWMERPETLDTRHNVQLMVEDLG